MRYKREFEGSTAHPFPIPLLSRSVEGSQQSIVENSTIEECPGDENSHTLPLAHAIDREISENLIIRLRRGVGMMLETVD